jgi:hypothetical protein
MQEHGNLGFYKVVIWKPGYLMFFMIEGRQTRKGLRYIVIPTKSKLFDEAKRFGAKNP